MLYNVKLDGNEVIVGDVIYTFNWVESHTFEIIGIPIDGEIFNSYDVVKTLFDKTFDIELCDIVSDTGATPQYKKVVLEGCDIFGKTVKLRDNTINVFGEFTEFYAE